MLLKISSTLIMAFLLVPIVAVVGSSFTATNFPTFPPRGFSLQWYAAVLNEPAFTDAMKRSFWLGLASSLTAGVLGTLSALTLSRLGEKGKLIGTLVMSPILFPTVVLGLALLIFFTRVGLAGTFFGLVVAHSLLTTPFVIRLTLASLAEFDHSLQEAARNLGASPMRTFFQITLPLISPGVIAGVLFAFILSFDELVVTLFLVGPEMQTLPIRIYTFLEYDSKPTISAVATLVILSWIILGLPLLALRSRGTRGKTKNG
ncbi:ABC transporter permease [Pseudogemmobacter sonorensis]|uniref:ABC transporter permease n=1 Tax=Pseudogemmobacter sonorensis TaxID=2989681 RepID=UPI0036885BB1